MKFKILTILILLLLSTFVTGQSVTKKDSASVIVQIEEFKLMIKSQIDLQLYKMADVKNNEKIGILNRIIEDKDSILSTKDKNIDLLRQEIETIKPAWYDNFLTGGIVGSLAILTLFILLK